MAILLGYTVIGIGSLLKSKQKYNGFCRGYSFPKRIMLLIMDINIIRSESSWVIGHITENYAKLIPNCKIRPVSFKGPSDVNIYITWGAYSGKTSAIDVAWFTHRENKKFDRVAKEVDYCVAMSNKTALLLPSHKTTVIMPGVDKQFSKDKIIFGCVGRNYPSSRKNFNWIQSLKQIQGVEFRFTDQKIRWEDMREFYDNIDYLLVLSDNEGGPMPVLEALACGKPIIAPDVGWAWEYPCIRYSGFDELSNTIQSMVITKDSWEISAQKMYNLCKELVNGISK